MVCDTDHLSLASGPSHPKKIKYHLAFHANKHEAFELLIKIFDEIKILDVEAFFDEHKYEPCVSSVFVVSAGGSYDFILDGTNCYVHNGTLCTYGNLPIVKLQHAYLQGIAPALPRGRCIGMGYQCPVCNIVNFPSAQKKTVLCKKCKMMYYV